MQTIHASSRELAATIRHAIQEGKYTSQFAFPSFRELSRQYGVSMRVVRAALNILEEEGLVYRRERQGTFVRTVPIRADGQSGTSTLKSVNIVERPTGTTPGFVRTGYLRGYTEALDRFDMRMRVVNSPQPGGDYESLFSPACALQEQGCILINLVDASLMQWLNDHKIPFVVQSYICYDKEGLPPHHSVAINKVGGGHLATQHLIDQGHRRIGFIGRTGAEGVPASEIFEGYRSALRCNGIELRKKDTLDYLTDESTNAVAPAKAFLERSDLPTAIVAETDMTAIGVIEAAKLIGISVPEELSVVGYNDQAEAELASPPLTTVSNHVVQLGRTAVDMLLAASAGDFEEMQTRVLRCHLVSRKTTTSPCR